MDGRAKVDGPEMNSADIRYKLYRITIGCITKEPKGV